MCYDAPKGTGDQQVPKLVHFTHPEDVDILGLFGGRGNSSNIVWRTCATAWLQHFPPTEYEYRFWSDVQSAGLVSQKCNEHWNFYRRAPSKIHQADLVRYCLLYRSGGIYSDLDYEPRANFMGELASSRVSLIGSPYHGEQMENSLMASPPRLDYWMRVLDLAVRRGMGGPPVKTTGPNLLRAMNTTEPHILPCQRFFRGTHADDVCFSSKKAFLPVRQGGWTDTACPCRKMLHANDSTDPGLLGVHWGTYTYWAGNNTPPGVPAPHKFSRIKVTFRVFHNLTMSTNEMLHGSV